MKSQKVNVKSQCALRLEFVSLVLRDNKVNPSEAVRRSHSKPTSTVAITHAS